MLPKILKFFLDMYEVPKLAKILLNLENLACACA